MPVALITGGGSLICEGIASVLAREGWNLVITDVNLELANEVAAKLHGGSAHWVERMDVTERDDVLRVVDGAVRRFGRIDGLVNGAGGGRGIGIPLRDFIDYEPRDWSRLLDVNLEGVFNTTHAVLPYMKAQGHGSIVSVAAGRGLKGGPRASVYSAAKAAVIVFSQSLAQEVGPLGIRVNTIAPGNTAARWKAADTGHIRSPLGRETSPEDVGNAVAFLMSDKAGHITGTCLDVTGGTALH